MHFLQSLTKDLLFSLILSVKHTIESGYLFDQRKKIPVNVRNSELSCAHFWANVIKELRNFIQYIEKMNYPIIQKAKICLLLLSAHDCISKVNRNLFSHDWITV